MNGNCGLYIHIPFCVSKCLYCDFYSLVDVKQMQRYKNELIEKIKYYGEKYNNKIFDTIYIGGGTPSVMGTENLFEIISCAMQSFDMVQPEITIEMNPCSAKNIDFFVLKSCGVNRISLGVQSAHENELKKLGRIHRNEDVVQSVKKIKNSGIDNISLDLMVGISEQTEQSLIESMDFCIGLDVKHISVYILKIEENTPYKRLAPSLNLPDDDEQADLYELMQSYLESKGYMQYEISNFCLDGFESRHNLKYWNCDEYLGIGSSAHSMMDNKRFYYLRSLEKFYNNDIVYDGIGGTSEEYIMLKMRLKEGLQFDEYKKYFHSDLPQHCIDVAQKYSKYGLMNINETGISFTPKGFLVSNVIIAELLA